MNWPLLVIAIVVVDLVFAGLLIWGLIRSGWAPLARAYPPRTPTPEAVGRRFQSYKIGLLNFGWSVHTAVDEGFLHLTPARFLRMLGAHPVSIPWEEITIAQRARSGKWITVRVRGTTIMGPAWCLTLAEPDVNGD